jgi:deglycase
MAKIAITLADGFEDSEFTVPYERLRAAGHEVTVVGTQTGETVTGKRGNASHRVDTVAATLNPDNFDALLIPGGHSPDRLRLDADVVDFTRRFSATGKPVAAICHGPQLLIEAGLVDGRTLTSWPSVRTDLINAGADWVDREVVLDTNLITSRKPDDLPVFCKTLVERLS